MTTHMWAEHSRTGSIIHLKSIRHGCNGLEAWWVLSESMLEVPVPEWPGWVARLMASIHPGSFVTLAG